MDIKTEENIDVATKLDEKAIDIAVLKREREKYEKMLKGLFKPKTYIILATISAILGGLVTFISYSKNYDSFTIELKKSDSLRAQNIVIYNNNYYPLDTFLIKRIIQNKQDSAKIIDSIIRKAREINENIETEFTDSRKKRLWRKIPLGCLIGLLVLPAYFFMMEILSKLLAQSRIRKIDYELLTKGAQELKDNIEKDFFTKLVEINFKYLDQYYLQTQEQADKSFWMSLFASCIGFIIIIIGIVLMFKNPTKLEPAYITTGAGVISEFISAIFFYLYNRTVQKMSQYHQKLVITQNISLALKTADALTGTKEKTLESIIERLTTDVNKYLTGGN